MVESYSFGYWVMRRRKALDLTRAKLATQVGCSPETIKKIERDERRPSRQIAEILANVLAIPPEEQMLFLEVARREHSVDHLPLVSKPLQPLSKQGLDLLPQPTHFVGRKAEFQQLADLIDQTNERSGHVALIEGEPGIGKSRLIREFADFSRAHGVWTLFVNCYQIEQVIPYQPVVDLVKQVLTAEPVDRLRDLSPISLAELALLVPDIARRFPNLPTPTTDLLEARQARLFGALLQLIDTYAGYRRLMLAVDDIHWADRASLQFLHFLARGIVNRPVLLICTFRGEEAAVDEYLMTFLHALKREPLTTSLTLDRLPLEAIDELLAAQADPAVHTPELVYWLHTETDGNPFFLVSMIQSLLEQGWLTEKGEKAWQIEPQKLSTAGAKITLAEGLIESVRNRLRHLTEPVRQILDMAAVLGRRFDFSTLQVVTQERQMVLLDSLEDLTRRQLLREEPDSNHYDFSHDKIREVVYHDLSPTRQILLHRKVAETLEASTNDIRSNKASLLAEHYERGQVWDKAITYLGLGGDNAKELFALTEALRFYNRAIQLAEEHPEATDPLTTLSIYERRGESRALASEFEGALADLKFVVDKARQTRDLSQQRSLLIRIGMVYRRADDYDRAKEFLIEALDVSRETTNVESVADALFHLGTVIWSQGDNDQAMKHHQEAVDIIHRNKLSGIVSAQALHGLGESFWMSAQPKEAIQALTESLTLARQIGDRGYEAEDLQMIGWTLVQGEANYRLAIERLNESLAISEAAHLDWHSVATLNALGLALGFAGDYSQGLAAINRGRQIAESIGIVRLLSVNLDCLGCLLLDLDLLEEAEAAYARGVKMALAINAGFWLPRLQANQAISHLRRSAPEIDDELKATLETARTRGQDLHVVCCLERLAEAALASSQFQEALDYADRLLALAESRDLRETTAQAHRWRGETLSATNDFDAAKTELHTALNLAESLGRVRLVYDVHVALEKLFHVQEQTESADHHQAAARETLARIKANVDEIELPSNLRKGQEGL